MKTTTVIALALLAALTGCAATQSVNTHGETITTRSRVYDADYAARAGITNAQTYECEELGRKVAIHFAGLTGAGMDQTRGGMAYESCVDQKRAAK